MEAVLTGQVAPRGRPGWWRMGWALAFGGFLGFCALMVTVLPLAQLAGVSPVTDGPDHGWPFVPAGPVALAADLGFAAFALAVLTIVSRFALNAWLDRDIAPTWVALGIGLGGFGPFFVGPLSSGGVGGLLVALVVVRFGGFDTGGRSRPGVLGGLRARSRAVARLLLVALPVAGLALACGYGVTHPLVAPQWSGSGLQALHTAEGPVRSFILPLEQRGLGHVTVLALRPAGGAVGRTRVVAAGEPASGLASDPPRGLVAAAMSDVQMWLLAPRCPAPAIVVNRLDARVRSWSGTHWVPLRLAPAVRLGCVG
jgi:hypothetical protein